MKPRVALITGFPSYVGGIPIFEMQLKLLEVLKSLTNEITWVATNCSGIENRVPERVRLMKIQSKEPKGKPLPIKLWNHLLQQVRVIEKLIKLKRIDICIFSNQAAYSILPILATKALRKKIIIRIDGRPSKMLESSSLDRANPLKIALWAFVERIVYSLADKILPENEYMINLYNLHRYQNKIANGAIYINDPFLRRGKRLVERDCQIGYTGRFLKAKGVLEFAQSLLYLLKEEGVQAIMIGDGNLKDDTKQILIRGNIQDKVELTGWIANSELPNYLRNIKIVVVPSYREGLPNLVLEAMGCGCVVVATPVGGIPGVIKDGETGFIMESNSPDCIARNVVRALNHPNLEEIAENARALVEKEYDYEAAAERYRNILATLG